MRTALLNRIRMVVTASFWLDQYRGP